MNSATSADRGSVFQPYAADLARAILIVRRSGSADLIDAQLRPTNRGRPREASSSALLTLVAYVLRVFKTAQSHRLSEAGSELLSPAAMDMIGLGSPDGRPLTRYQIDYFFRAVSRVYAHDRLRPLSAHLRDAERDERRRAYQHLVTCLCSGWLPEELPRGNLVVFDATGQPTAARPLSKRVRQALMAENSIDLLTHAERELPNIDREQLQRRRSHRAVEGRFGHQTETYEHPAGVVGGFNFYNVMLVSPDDSAPPLLLTTTMTPSSGTNAGELLLEQLELINGEISDDSVVVADREYSKSDAVWQGLRSRNRRFVFDLYPHQRRPRGEYRGILLAQGIGMCPATPSELIDPGERPIAQQNGKPRAAWLAWVRRVDQRAPYRCHIRSVRPTGLNLACPALAPARVQCQLRNPNLDPTSSLPIVQNHPDPSGRPAVCSNATVFLPDEHNPYRQSFPWGQKQWDKTFAYGRASIEGGHGLLKYASGQALTRWVTFSSLPSTLGILVALDLAFVQLKLIRNWLQRHADDPVAAKLLADPLYADDEQARAWLRNNL